MIRFTTRRSRPARTAGAALAAFAVLATAACSSDSGADEVPVAAPTVPAVPVSTSTLPQLERGSYPVVFRHTWGVTRVEDEPERVVVLGMREQDTMTSLGVKPLSVRNYFGADHPWTSFPWVPEEAKAGDYTEFYFPTRDSRTGRVAETTDGPVLDNEFAQASNTPERKEVFDTAAIERLDPDLIVVMYAGITLEDFQALTAIAPTVTMVSSDSKDYFSSWQEEARALGAILGRPLAANQLVQDVQQKFVDAQFENSELKDATVALAAPGPNGTIRIMNPYAPMSRFFTALGMEFPGRIEAATRYQGVSRKMYAIETPTSSGLSFLDNVDALVWIVGHDGGEAMERLKETSAYQNMRVVRDGNVIELGPDVAEALYYSSVTSLPWALERLLPEITAVLSDKKARDREAEQDATEAAEQAGDLAIDFEPDKTAAPNPYQEMLEGDQLAATPAPETSAPETSDPAEPDVDPPPAPSP